MKQISRYREFMIRDLFFIALTLQQFFFGRFRLILRLYCLKAVMMNSEKLLQLRAKTDRQLLDFVHFKLEAGLNFAALIDLHGADCALREAQALLPAINEKQRRELYPKINKLRDALARLRHRESPRVRAACSF
jgi:hypothetical protein